MSYGTPNNCPPPESKLSSRLKQAVQSSQSKPNIVNSSTVCDPVPNRTQVPAPTNVTIPEKVPMQSAQSVRLPYIYLRTTFCHGTYELRKK